MTESDERTDATGPVGRLAGRLAPLAFWSAIVLPVFYLAVLINRITTVSELLLFVGLLGLHVLALVVGHPFQQGNRR